MTTLTRHAEDDFTWARAATAAAMLTAACLCIAKAVAFYMTGSAAILGSLADSGLDLFGSFAAAAAVRYAALPPDDNHRYGHQKAEALAAIAQLALLAASATLVAWESTQRLIHPQPVENVPIAIWVLVSSGVTTLILVAFQTVAIRRSGSLLVRGDRAHYLGDVLASAGALGAIVLGSTYGMPRADAVAGLIAAVFLAFAGWQVARRAIPQLMDQEIPQDEQDAIHRILVDDPDVLDYHALRTRRAGIKRFVQLDIQIHASHSFRDAHAISDRVELAIENLFFDADVIVHPDPDGEARMERRALEEHSDDTVDAPPAAAS
ncbi:MAG: cation diffusion facilitator family transporter [Pseudomonadota bacterium]